MIALIRHADAGRRRPLPDDDRRPLTEAGVAQAEGLVDVLANQRFGRILSSPYLRCRQTVEPIAAACGLAVEPVEQLSEGNAGTDVLAMLLELAGSGIAACSHGDVIGGVLQHLVETGLVRPADARFPKGSTWLLELAEGRVKSARYFEPVGSRPGA